MKNQTIAGIGAVVVLGGLVAVGIAGCNGGANEAPATVDLSTANDATTAPTPQLGDTFTVDGVDITLTRNAGIPALSQYAGGGGATNTPGTLVGYTAVVKNGSAEQLYPYDVYFDAQSGTSEAQPVDDVSNDYNFGLPTLLQPGRTSKWVVVFKAEDPADVVVTAQFHASPVVSWHDTASSFSKPTN